MPESSVDIRNLSHSYGERPALRDVSLRVASGVLLALLGPNGSGKTTLFRVLSTLLLPGAGSARICGLDVVSDASKVRSLIGVVFQHIALDAELTVTENLRHHGALYGLRGTTLRTRVQEAIEAVGLSGRANERVRTLSGGLARRADLGRVLMHRPRLLLLDEPTSGLDPAARREFWQAIGLMQRASATTIVVATHLLEEAEQCDDIAIMSEGQIVIRDTPGALKATLGEETLWLESEDVQRLAEAIDARFGVEARIVGGMIQISHPHAHTLLARIYEAMSDDITSATVRRPTLEDVFLVHTGRGAASPVHALYASESGEAVPANRSLS